MSEVIQEEQNLDQDFENVLNEMGNVKRTEVDENNMPVDVEILSLGHIRGKLANYEWRTVNIEGQDVAVKVLKGDAFDHFMLLGKDDIAYMSSLAKDPDNVQDLENEVNAMDHAEQIKLAQLNKRQEEAIVVAYILEPKFTMDDDPEPGVLHVSEISPESRGNLVDAYHDVNTPKEVVDSVERFQ